MLSCHACRCQLANDAWHGHPAWTFFSPVLLWERRHDGMAGSIAIAVAAPSSLLLGGCRGAWLGSRGGSRRGFPPFLDTLLVVHVLADTVGDGVHMLALAALARRGNAFAPEVSDADLRSVAWRAVCRFGAALCTTILVLLPSPASAFAVALAAVAAPSAALS